MTANQITRSQARPLARLLHEIRSTLGPQHVWDTSGCEAALYDARDIAPSPELAVAAIRAAWNPANRTPAIIALDGPHWREPATSLKPRDPFDASKFCQTCGQREDRCRERWAGDHEFESVVHARQRKGQHDISPVVAEIKGHLAPTKPASEPVPTAENPRVAQARELLHPTTKESTDV